VLSQQEAQPILKMAPKRKCTLGEVKISHEISRVLATVAHTIVRLLVGLELESPGIDARSHGLVQMLAHDMQCGESP